MALSIGGSYNIPSVNYVNGFNASKIQNIVIDGDDLDKYGIDPEDFSEVDSNEDGIITASEFLSSGIDITSIFNAYKQLASRIEGAYVEPGNNIAQNNNTQNGVSNPIQQQQNSLNHPSVAHHPFLAQNIDFSA